MTTKVGTVFSYMQYPDVSKFPFVISKRQDGILIRKGMFVYTNTIEGFLIGIIEKIVLLNEYFSDALTIKSYNDNTNPNILKGLFPSDDFEFAIALVKCLGIVNFKHGDKGKISMIKRMSFPAKPGAEVALVEEEILCNFIGLDMDNGINLGTIKVTPLEARVNLDNLLNKHFAILAISGAGKSYLTSVLIEEMLTRGEDLGTPAIVLIDVHGEYAYLKDIPELSNKVDIYDMSYFQISVPKLKPYVFKKYQEQLSHVQVRELSKYIKILRKDEEKKGLFSIRDIIELIEQDEEGNKNTKQALIGWLIDLDRLMIFGAQENPSLKRVVNQRKITIFNLEQEISIRKKQIVVDYICNRLFSLRRMDKVAPFLLVIEEAHQFCPEAAHSKALSKSIIETIAREGRKFMACLCLISQRPKRLSTTALSQCNSKMILNVQNPYDLKHLMDSSEAITKEYADMISTLGVGEMVLMGNAVNYPIFINVREKRYKTSKDDLSLSQMCLKWQEVELG